MEKLEWRTCWRRRLLNKVVEEEGTTRRYWAPPREIAVRVELMGMRSPDQNPFIVVQWGPHEKKKKSKAMEE